MWDVLSGDFDINLPLDGSSGVECRDGAGNHRLVLTFTNPVVSGTASVTSGTGSVSGSPTFSGNTMTVNLTGVTNPQSIDLTLTSVTDSSSQVLPTRVLTVKFLVGDVNGNKTVSASDIAEIKSRSGAVLNGTNFKDDLNLSGTINATDLGQVKGASGNTVP